MASDEIKSGDAQTKGNAGLGDSESVDNKTTRRYGTSLLRREIVGQNPSAEPHFEDENASVDVETEVQSDPDSEDETPEVIPEDIPEVIAAAQATDLDFDGDLAVEESVAHSAKQLSTDLEDRDLVGPDGELSLVDEDDTSLADNLLPKVQDSDGLDIDHVAAALTTKKAGKGRGKKRQQRSGRFGFGARKPSTTTTARAKEEAKRVRTKRAKKMTRRGLNLGLVTRRFYRTFALITFTLTTITVAYVLGRPWYDDMLLQREQEVSLPSLESLKAMSRAERQQFRDNAIIAARTRIRNVVGETLPPAIGGDLIERGTYRLEAVEPRFRVEGVARHFELPDGRKFLRFSEFEIPAGYDLRLLLALTPAPGGRSDLEESGFVDLAPFKGENGNQNYLLPDTFNLEDFSSIVIYDQLFEVVYAYAVLDG